ncbi:potassium voltage-gated channel protein Shal-like isoform X2 [Actinia tenebrosa]|uniref:Potassium voltage-gated channel protein Shal-like isoform X2 n=1 Tax=Actinia tenebrosa TaxID=6105 RepID=A0A6P8I5N1_ACTTE|nr:potassium voltage-gated channel protein Shal-like isoform X2 [Actinia tenebrosa]XP_031563244.1 potassium voltage-gated channel protein Shal-like isoform X2 [Actinia tenebrosa]XP_031563245.1 potassium voltage-gated channel protein Shal-like isoform X2 [Actinia tenebrosa]
MKLLDICRRDGKEGKIDQEILELIAERAARKKAALKEREKSIQRAQNRRCLTTINVSGQRFVVDKDIFSRFPDTLLGSNFKESFFDSQRKEYFFDRDPEVFKYIIIFYKTGKLHFPEEECACCFDTECRYFGIQTDIMSDCCHEPFGEQTEDFKEYLRRNRPLEIPKVSDNQACLQILRRKMWKIFEDPGGNIFGLLLHYISAVFIVVSVISSVVETIPCGIQKCGKKYAKEFFLTEAVCVTLFTSEYVSRLFAAPKRWEFVKKFLSIIDLIAILPFYVGLISPKASEGPFTVLRVFRIFRIVKMSRHSTKVQQAGSSLRESFSELSFVFVVLAVMIIIFSSVIYYAESAYPDTNFTSIPATFWYTIVTMTTLGYGDLVPESIVGRLTGALCSLSGILVVALPAPVLEKNMKKARKGEEDDRLPLTFRENQETEGGNSEVAEEQCEVMKSDNSK